MALLFQNPRKHKYNSKSSRKSQIIYLANTLISLSVESSTACGVGGWLVVHHSCPHPSYPAFVSKGYPSPSPYLPLVHSFEPPSGYYAPILGGGPFQKNKSYPHFLMLWSLYNRYLTLKIVRLQN